MRPTHCISRSRPGRWDRDGAVGDVPGRRDGSQPRRSVAARGRGPARGHRVHHGCQRLLRSCGRKRRRGDGGDHRALGQHRVPLAGPNAGCDRSGPIGSYALSFAASGFTSATSNTITLSAGPAAKLAVTTQPSSSVQNAIAFPQQPVVQLQDAAGNNVSQAGVGVTPAIATGVGTLSPTTAVLTNGSGSAGFSGLTITGTVGPRTLSFTSGTLAAVTSNTVTVTAGTATRIAVNGGNNQAAPAGTAVATPPAVIVRDVSDNPVPSVAVTFAVPGTSNGTITGASQTTNAGGIAQVTSWTLGMQAKPDTLTATSTGLSGSPVTFVDTAKVGAAASIVKFSGDGLTGQVGATLATPHDVLLTDASGNPVAGVTVTWAAATGGGSVNLVSSVTNASGHAQTTRTLGPTPGTQTTTAAAP